MAQINLSYADRDHAAVVEAGEGCTQRQWGAVRRLFEERSGATVVAGLRLTVPWWEFLAHRDALKFVLRSEGLNIVVDHVSGDLLRTAVARETAFKARGTRPMFEQDIEARLIGLGFTRTLLPYQLRNVSRLSGLVAGATFSVPGSGKTTEALAFFFLTREADDKLLVVAPNNAFVAWEDELPACVPSNEGHWARLAGGADQIANILSTDPPYCLISYHQLPYVMDALRGYLSRNRVCMFVDESHRMKRGDDGVHGQCLLRLSYLVRRKLLLSGTPMPNGQNDLVSQFRFLYPEIRTSADSVVVDIQGCFVRTTKAELGLPAVVRIEKRVPMTIPQQKLYEVLASDAARHLEHLDVRDRMRFRSISRCVQHMLQAASNPALLGRSGIAAHELMRAAMADGASNKIHEACRIAREWVAQGKKVLIWSCFVRSVEHLAGILADVGAEYIHGGVTVDEDEENLISREAVIRRFNDPESGCRVLVANPAACSEGISLHHVCHHAIYVDRNYNAAQYLQSEDRIHRIGLPQDVTTQVVILTSPGTIDESVARRLNDKVQRMAIALNDAGLNVSPIPLDELADGIDEDDVNDLKVLLGVSA